MAISLLEKALIKVSRRHSYIVKSSLAGDELTARRDVALLFDKEDAFNRVLQEGIDSSETAARYLRLVYTPTGMISYRAILIEPQDTFPVEAIDFYHGNKIDEWRKKNIPLSDRLNNHWIHFTFMEKPESEYIDSTDISFGLNISNPSSNPVYTTFLHSGENYNAILVRGIAESHYAGDESLKRSFVNTAKLPKNYFGYEAILEWFASFIEKN